MSIPLIEVLEHILQPTVHTTVSAQSTADVYGVAVDAACVIILVFITSIGCVTTLR